jgi:hypothetical protein
MATPQYDAIVAKTRDWSNKPEVNTIPDSVIQDCLRYSADECYRTLRIPPLEYTTKYTVTSDDNIGESSAGLPYGSAYTSFIIPEDLTQFNYLRTVATAGSGAYASNVSKVFNEITDKRTFFDIYAEKYSAYNWMWMDNKVYIHPQLAVGDIVEINYYRRLPSLDALYSVIPVNYLIGLSDSNQPYVALTDVNTDTPLYFAGAGVLQLAFSSLSAAQVYGNTQPITTVTTKYYAGKEVPNWLRDQNERMLIWGALYNLGAYLFDDKMEARYQTKFIDNINSINKEEKFRRAAGGNVQMNFNTNGMI